MEIIILAIFVAVLAYEIVNSSLAMWIKELFYVDKEYPVVQLLASFKTYHKLLGKYVYVLWPLILVLVVLSNIHRFIYRVIQCAYCLVVWLGIIAGLINGYTIIISIIVGFVGSFITSIYSKLRE